MLTENPLPKFAKPNKGLRGWTDGHLVFGNNIRSKRTRKAPPRSWPPHIEDFIDHMHPANSNREFLRHVAHYWKNELSTQDRADWATLAASITITNYKAQAITPQAYELYVHFETCWKPYWYYPNHVFDPTDSILDTAPYTPWTPPPAPSNFVVTAVNSQGFDFTFTGIPGFAYRGPTMSGTIAIPRRSERTMFTHSQQDIIYTATSPFPWDGHYSGWANWNWILPVPPQTGLYAARIRYLPTPAPYTPSDYTDFQVIVPPGL